MAKARETRARKTGKQTEGKRGKAEEVPAQSLFKEIRRAVDTGKVVFGKTQSEKGMLNGNVEVVIVSSNTPSSVKEKVMHLSKITSIPLLEFAGTGIELGSVCGKPFTVSVMAVEKSGKSKIMSAVKQ